MTLQSCTIRNNTIRLGNHEVFSAPNKSLPDFLHDAYEFLGVDYPKFYKMDNQCKAGFLAAEALLGNGDLRERFSAWPRENVSLLLANRSGSLDTDQRYFATTKTMASPALFVYTLPNIVAGELSIRHRIKGETGFFVMPEFDAGFLAAYSDQLMREKSSASPAACMVGWIDVMGEHHDVFLYLRETAGTAGPTPEQIRSLYIA